MAKILIYGANGYTGKLIVEEAVKRNQTPVIAGRNNAAIEAMAKQYGLESRVFGLDSQTIIQENLSDIDILIHCAGPFSATAKPMMDACIATKTHYTDITGEIAVFELAQSNNEQAKQAGIVICPGVGFDVIPTDCIAAHLKKQLPSATHLSLGFDSGSRLSPGTAKTSVEGLGQGGKVRRDGKLVTVPLAYKTRTIDFGNGDKFAVSIPWGDVSTAYHSTAIPNIEVYIPISPRRAKQMARLNIIRWLLDLGFVKNFMKKKAGQSAKGPNAEQREKLETYVWGEAKDDSGKVVTARVKTANGYTVTYLGALAVADFLSDYSGEGGAYTPSKLIDENLITKFEGTGEITFS